MCDMLRYLSMSHILRYLSCSMPCAKVLLACQATWRVANHCVAVEKKGEQWVFTNKKD